MKKLPILGLVLVPIVGLVAAITLAFDGHFSGLDLAMCLIGGALTEYGVTFGFHRLIVHQGFEPNKVLKAIVLALGSMAFQGPVIHWASVHTKHHAFSDQEGDPHSPSISGFFHAHFEWLIEMNSTELEGIVEKWGKRYAKDPMVMWFSKTFLFWSVFSLVLPAAIGFAVSGGNWMAALTGFLWGGLVRIFLSSHVTWSVNSVCHYFGSRQFKTTDDSKNNFIVGILALGEGWHNNHHAFPASAFHGLRWWQIDVTGLSIRIFEKLGLVKKVVRIPEGLLEKRSLNSASIKTQELSLIDVEELTTPVVQPEPAE